MPTSLVPQSPLLQPILHNGQPYFTSQYFHAEYLRNSPHGGKYRRHSDFSRALQSIPSYGIYCTNGDIHELSWQETKANPALVHDFKHLSACFADAGFHRLIMLNKTAQAALSHHLDDEASKQLSVAINRSVGTASGVSRQLENAEADLQSALGIMALLGIPTHIGQQEALKMVEASTGVRLQHLLSAAPAQDAVADDAVMLEPTDLARVCGLSSGAAMNAILAALGWQVRAIGGGWEPTPNGQPHCTRHAWTSGHSTKSGYNLKWTIAAVREALAAQQAQAVQP